MHRVWKYHIPAQDVFNIQMPAGSTTLSCDIQFGEPYLWALVPESEVEERHNFVLLGTGNPVFLEPNRFIGTILLEKGSLVLHLFEMGIYSTKGEQKHG